MPDFWNGCARLSIITETGDSEPIPIPLVPFPEIDRFPDGRLLVVSTRARSDEANALILGEQGQRLQSVALGDGIAHVRCAPDGTIWVGYFDEGVFGGSVGAGGIVRFGTHGEPLWSYNSQERDGQSFADDCYALTLNGDELWSCFYSGFPILHIRGSDERLWNNDIGGAKALAVDSPFVLLAGGYGDDADRLALLEPGKSEARLLGSYRCSRIANADLLCGRASVIHAVKDGSWTSITVAEALARLG